MAQYPQYQVKQSFGQYYFVLRAVNAETLLTSERYTTKQACLGGIASVKTHAAQDSNYNRLTATNSQPYFTLRSTNYQVLGTSETYVTVIGRDNGIAACKRDAPVATIVDLTLASV